LQRKKKVILRKRGDARQKHQRKKQRKRNLLVPFPEAPEDPTGAPLKGEDSQGRRLKREITRSQWFYKTWKPC